MKSLIACGLVLALGGCAATMGDVRPFATPEGPARGYAAAPAPLQTTPYAAPASAAAGNGGGSIYPAPAAATAACACSRTARPAASATC